MDKPQIVSDFAAINDAQIYYEIAGEGQPFVMIHAGVADSRQWNNEFSYFAENHRVLRYDLRGYGKSEPVEGDFCNLTDLTGLLDYLHLDQPLILMGCSMGGGLAIDFALAYPARVCGLIMVGSGPSGLELNLPEPEKFNEAERAYQAGDLNLTAEIETQIWFDGIGRTPDQVDQAMRSLAYEMNRKALEYSTRKLGKLLPDGKAPAAGRLQEIDVPVLIVTGEFDVPYIHAAADFMAEHIPTASRVILSDAAHLPNLDHPGVFRQHLERFMDSLQSQG